MEKIKKDYNLKIVSLIIAAIFLLNSAVYGMDLSAPSLRAPIGSQDTYYRMSTIVSRNSKDQKGHLIRNIAFFTLGIMLSYSTTSNSQWAPRNHFTTPPFFETLDTITLVSPVEIIMDSASNDLNRTMEIISQYLDEYKMGHQDNLDMLLKNADKFINKPWAKEIFKFIAEQDRYVLRNYDEPPKIISSQPWAPEIFKIIYDPVDMLLNYEVFADQPYAIELLESSAIFAPVQAIEGGSIFIWGENPGPPIDYKAVSLKQNSDIIKLLRNSKNPAVKKLCQLYDWGIKNLTEDTEEYALEMALLLDRIVKDNLSFEEAYEITKNTALFFKNLIEIKGRPDHLGAYSIDRSLEDISLRVVESLNELHDSPDAVRFESIKNYDSQTLYTVMVYGENEVFTSTFNGLFSRMLDKMKKEGLTVKALFEKAGYNKFRTMIKLCAAYNRLNEFLDTMDKGDRMELLERFVTINNDVDDMLSQAVTIADAFSMLRDKNVLEIIQRTIEKEYKAAVKENNKEIKVIYGLLSGIFSDKAVFDADWFKKISEQYRLVNITKMLEKDMFDNNLNIQRYYSYNDPDGKASYNSLIKQYSGQENWLIFDNGAYTIIRSKALAGRKIEIYINKPAFEEEGQHEISEALKGKRVNVEVHMGHSYHANKTISMINPEASLIILRSCGGYSEISKILDKDPEAHIISTKGTGTMYVNEPLLYLLNNEMLKGRDIIWQDFWSKAEKILGRNQNFWNYIAPHKNLGVLFLKAYRKLIHQEQAKNPALGFLLHNISAEELINTSL